jgi:thioredoxin-dependent peroxiredoxin
MKRYGIAAALVALVAGIGGMRARAETPLPAVGQPAPDFSLQGSDGKAHSLQSHRGRQPLVLAFYPKAFTSGWTLEICSLRDELSPLKAYGAVVYGISEDPLPVVKDFARQEHLNYVLLSDAGHKVATTYGVLLPAGYAKRVTFVIDRDGVIRYVDTKVDVRSHGKDLEAILARVIGKKQG